jgi:hypothetical protein
LPIYAAYLDAHWPVASQLDFGPGVKQRDANNHACRLGRKRKESARRISAFVLSRFYQHQTASALGPKNRTNPPHYYVTMMDHSKITLMVPLTKYSIFRQMMTMISTQYT